MIKMSEKKLRKRIKIREHYMQVRQRSTRKGKKGTIRGKWESEQRGKRRTYRCKLPIFRRLKMMICENKKAGKSCLKVGNHGKRCQKLEISYT